jgi:catechol 2,3-dioxygenase-like lactoylglutathione lyase family enzyme
LRLLRQFDTCRLIPSRFVDKEDSVLSALADNDDELRDLFELDNATNARLLAEHGGAPGISIEELVFYVPNYRSINAAFTYARPEGSRFNNGERGAWYCAFEAETALAEVIFHKTVEYAEIDRFDDSVSYQACACWRQNPPA